MSELLFIYGTLRLASVQLEIIGRETELVVDILNGYTTEPVFIDGLEYRTLAADKNSSVEGAVISLTAEELSRIDAYEPAEYHRISVTTVSGTPVWVYVRA